MVDALMVLQKVSLHDLHFLISMQTCLEMGVSHRGQQPALSIICFGTDLFY